MGLYTAQPDFISNKDQLEENFTGIIKHFNCEIFIWG